MMMLIAAIAEAGAEAPNTVIPRLDNGYCDGCGDFSSVIPSNTAVLGPQLGGVRIR